MRKAGQTPHTRPQTALYVRKAKVQTPFVIEPTNELSTIAGSYMSHEDEKVRKLAAYVLLSDKTPGKRNASS